MPAVEGRQMESTCRVLAIGAEDRERVEIDGRFRRHNRLLNAQVPLTIIENRSAPARSADRGRKFKLRTVACHRTECTVPPSNKTVRIAVRCRVRATSVAIATSIGRNRRYPWRHSRSCGFGYGPCWRRIFTIAIVSMVKVVIGHRAVKTIEAEPVVGAVPKQS